MPTGGCPTGRASPSGSRAGSPYHRSRPKVRSTPGAGEEAQTARRARGTHQARTARRLGIDRPPAPRPQAGRRILRECGYHEHSLPSDGVPEQPPELHAVSTPLLTRKQAQTPQFGRVLLLATSAGGDIAASTTMVRVFLTA